MKKTTFLTSADLRARTMDKSIWKQATLGEGLLQTTFSYSSKEKGVKKRRGGNRKSGTRQNKYMIAWRRQLERRMWAPPVPRIVSGKTGRDRRIALFVTIRYHRLYARFERRQRQLAELILRKRAEKALMRKAHELIRKPRVDRSVERALIRQAKELIREPTVSRAESRNTALEPLLHKNEKNQTSNLYTTKSPSG